MKMDYWIPKHVELLNVTNKINHQILCILLDYGYIARCYRVHTASDLQNFSYRCKGKNTCYVTLVTCVIFPVYGHVTELLVVREKHRLNLSENKILQMAFFWPCYSSSLLRLWGGLVDSSGRARWCFTFNSIASWRYPSASIHCTSESPKKYVALNVW